jgi:nucleoside-diphosphate-sugar epimerase
MPHLLVTGASGFLGGRTAAHFAGVPDFLVRATSRSTKKAGVLTQLGCEFVPGDLTDANFVSTLVAGIDIIVHCAALSSPYGIKSAFESANIIATETLLQAARNAGVSKFIFISTPTIYVDLTSKFNVKESDPLPRKPVNRYAETKLLAEQIVLSNNTQAIQTLALRPRAIIGAEDTVIFPRVLNAYEKGKLKIVGRGDNLCDLTCVRNVIEAIQCAIHAPDHAFGEAYNITNGEPVNFWEMLNYALESLGYDRVTKKVPKGLAIRVAGLVESYYKLFLPHNEPTLTAYGIAVLADHFTMDITKAKRLLNYKPVMTTKEGIDEFIAWYKIQ